MQYIFKPLKDTDRSTTKLPIFPITPIYYPLLWGINGKLW